MAEPALSPMADLRALPAAEQLRRALDHPDPVAGPWRRTRGPRFAATGLDRSKGDRVAVLRHRIGR